MRHWAAAIICAVAGVAIITVGLMVPAHLRAVDDTVLERAASSGPDLINRGLALAYEKNLGAIQLLSRAADARKISGREKLATPVSELSQHSDLKAHGLQETGELGRIFTPASKKSANESEPVTEFIIQN
ncbi:MAG TPA: hypothetical protein VK327_14780, partial [Candidatus Paceibacterota bacterium]|nr:hypothetical protein [Candidatus Paceibacterota bacterium]